jgi:hypothetical protein
MKDNNFRNKFGHAMFGIKSHHNKYDNQQLALFPLPPTSARLDNASHIG